MKNSEGYFEPTMVGEFGILHLNSRLAWAAKKKFVSRSPSVENGRAEAKSVGHCWIFPPLAQAPKT